jgi:hypothetical protein
MASKLLEQLLNGVAGTISAIAQEKLTELFVKLHDHNPEEHSATLRSLYIGVGQLEKITDESKTKLDDAVVDALKGAIEQSAEDFDVELKP